jgi:hypothetical protein
MGFVIEEWGGKGVNEKGEDIMGKNVKEKKKT